MAIRKSIFELWLVSLEGDFDFALGTVLGYKSRVKSVGYQEGQELAFALLAGMIGTQVLN
jgi:hypothetical protein